MTAPGFLVRSRADVPDGDGWLGPREQAVQAGLHVEQRRTAWRLGRWTAKSAVAVLLGAALAEVEVVADAQGAPQAWIAGRAAPVALSLSHRGELALAVAGEPRLALGCDLELVEPRSDAFVREWLAPRERALVGALHSGEDAALLANLIWTGKEAAAKVRREGLRLDVRRAVVTLGDRREGAWRQLSVAWPDGVVTPGWCCALPGHVMTVAAARPTQAPVSLDAPAS